MTQNVGDSKKGVVGFCEGAIRDAQKSEKRTGILRFALELHEDREDNEVVVDVGNLTPNPFPLWEGEPEV